MLTEGDTFKELKKTSYRDLKVAYADWFYRNSVDGYVERTKAVEYLATHGWTLEQYIAGYYNDRR